MLPDILFWIFICVAPGSLATWWLVSWIRFSLQMRRERAVMEKTFHEGYSHDT